MLGAIINVLQAALPTTLASHTLMFAFLLVIAILVLMPDGLVTVRFGVLVAGWRRLREAAPAARRSAAVSGPARLAGAAPHGLGAALPVRRRRRELGARRGVDKNVYTRTAVLMFLLLIVVLGLQIFSGNSGVLSFGHIAFMSVGAYASALLTIPTDDQGVHVPRHAAASCARGSSRPSSARSRRRSPEPGSR